MGTPSEFEREKLFSGILYTNERKRDLALSKLVGSFGKIDFISREFSFSSFSDYYGYEMDGEVMRTFVSFENPVDPSEIAKIKLATNEIEAVFSVDGKRCVNIDPGLINRGALLLPTTKPAGHRIALSCGIYIEMTLFWSRGRWNTFPWTYRDFASEGVQLEMKKIRDIYIKARRNSMRKEN
ncbi:MAG: DUF4416 family protein [Clostridiales bacterium]|nr:DUF4416 family protein [Clostridiales bacterium]